MPHNACLRSHPVQHAERRLGVFRPYLGDFRPWKCSLRGLGERHCARTTKWSAARKTEKFFSTIVLTYNFAFIHF